MEGKMKGYAMYEVNKTGWIEKDIPEIKPMDALLKPIAVACCTTDIKMMRGMFGPRYNRILGHEAVAEVVEVGSMVKTFKPGDRVIVPAVVPEWGAIASQEGFPQHSNGENGAWLYSNLIDGVFSEYFSCPEADANLIPLPENVKPSDATMMADMVPPGFTAVELADVQFGDTVLVIGIGGAGLMAVAGAYMRGAGKIIAVGRRQVTKDAAKKYGADVILDYTDGDIYEQVMKVTGNKAVDCVCVCGGPAASYAAAFKCVKPGGKIGSIISIAANDKIEISGEYNPGMNDKQIIGAGMYTGRAKLGKLTGLMASGKLDTSPLVTHIFHGWDGLEQAVQLMIEKPDDMIKPVVLFE